MKKYDLDNDYVIVKRYIATQDTCNPRLSSETTVKAIITFAGEERILLREAVQRYFYHFGNPLEIDRMVRVLLRDGSCFLNTSTGLHVFLLEK